MKNRQRFVREGLAQVDRRFGRLTTPAPHDDRAALTVVEQSRVFHWLWHATTPIVAAYESSLLASWFRSATLYWHESRWSDRFRALGVAVATAAAVHLLLNLTLGDPHGWMWLLIPATAMAIASLLLIASSGDGATTRGR